MVEAVCHAAKVLGLPAEVMGNVLRLIKSVEEAAHEDRITLVTAAPHVNQADLLNDLIQEYSERL